MEPCDGVVVKEFIKDEWWEVRAEMGGVVDYVAGDLVWEGVRRGWGLVEGEEGVQASLLPEYGLRRVLHGTCPPLCTCRGLEPVHKCCVDQ